MRKQIIVTTRGGVGDVLLCTPALRAVKESYPDHKLIVYCLKKAHWNVLQHNPYIDSLRIISTLHLLRYPVHLYHYLFNKWWKKGYMFNIARMKHYRLLFQHIPISLIYEKNVKDIVPEVFHDLDVRCRHRKIGLFFTRQEEEKARKALEPHRRVVLMHVFSRTSVNHHWPAERWEELVRQLPEYTFIQIGLPDEPYVKGALDWRSSKMTIRETLCLIKYADSFVGVESSMGHATNAFDIPGVVLFGDTSPVHWGHENNINIYKSIRCSPCYHYVSSDPCPYGHECMRFITVEEVRKAIVSQMNTDRISYRQLHISTP